jgi:hypothetical protein
MNRIVSLYKDTGELASHVSVPLHVRIQQEEGHLQTRKQALTNTRSVGTLISDFHTLEFSEMYFCCLSHLVYGILNQLRHVL